MKQRMIVTAAALVLALTALTVLNGSVSRTALPVEMQVRSAVGDRSAAEGLTVDYRIALDQCLRWYTRYDPAHGSNESDFSMTYRNDTNRSLGYVLQVEWGIEDNAVDWRNESSPVVSALREAAEREARQNAGDSSVWVRERLYLSDYYDIYPLRVNNDYDMDTVIPFDKLRIPVSENDFRVLGCTFTRGTDGQLYKNDYSYSEDASFTENAFTPYSVTDEDGVLMTVGFPAFVQPQEDWAPEGFGLWYMPIRQQATGSARGVLVQGRYPAAEECRLVYPLDIATQRVALLERSADGAYILLVTVEDGRFLLHVLDGDSYRLVQKLELDDAPLTELTTVSQYLDDTPGAYRTPVQPSRGEYAEVENYPGVVQFVVTEQNYPQVTVRQGENFAALIMGQRLAVLKPTAQGYTVAILCDTPSYGFSLYTVEGYSNTLMADGESRWFVDEQPQMPEGAASYDPQITPAVDASYAMAFDGTRLAVAAYAKTDTCRLLLSIYDRDGLAYAEASESSVLSQEGKNYAQASVLPQDGEGWWNAMPGLSWQP